jgi:hypothetical protein
MTDKELIKSINLGSVPIIGDVVEFDYIEGGYNSFQGVVVETELLLDSVIPTSSCVRLKVVGQRGTRTVTVKLKPVHEDSYKVDDRTWKIFNGWTDLSLPLGPVIKYSPGHLRMNIGVCQELNEYDLVCGKDTCVFYRPGCCVPVGRETLPSFGEVYKSGRVSFIVTYIYLECMRSGSNLNGGEYLDVLIGRGWYSRYGDEIVPSPKWSGILSDVKVANEWFGRSGEKFGYGKYESC